ncbi:hypothetical protein EYB25_009876 [Talaromyces marneffei]|nr:hypothetical protein EYB25_009876 [Talaromyces marneffei]
MFARGTVWFYAEERERANVLYDYLVYVSSCIQYLILEDLFSDWIYGYVFEKELLSNIRYWLIRLKFTSRSLYYQYEP